MSLLKNPAWWRGEELFHKASRNKGEGRDLRLRRNEAFWNRARRPQGIHHPGARRSRSYNNLGFRIRCRDRFFNRLLCEAGNTRRKVSTAPISGKFPGWGRGKSKKVRKGSCRPPELWYLEGSHETTRSAGVIRTDCDG
jgi:hypothetical protein